jgi:hypothetical protein
MSSEKKLVPFDIEDPHELEEKPPEIKHKALFGVFVAANVVLPWAAGALMLLKKDKLEEWGWI